MARAKALKLYGLPAHWDKIEHGAWVEPLIGWQEEEGARGFPSTQHRAIPARKERYAIYAHFYSIIYIYQVLWESVDIMDMVSTAVSGCP